ncbi:MAG: hypothetical protein JXR07_16900 [Reichenbachiella sp.]
MKGLINKIVISACFVLSVTTASFVQAQVPDFDPEALDISEFLKAGSQDASTLMGQYLNPVFRGFGFGANGGWYNTAAAHKSLGFDLTVSVMMAQAPESDYFFEYLQSNYSDNLSLLSGDPMNGSTVFGDPNTTWVMQSTVSDPNGIIPDVSTSFSAPPGIDYDDLGIADARGLVPFVMVQGGIGLFKNTDLKIRWMPKMEFDVGGTPFSAEMLGLGIMHDIKQWIPGIKHVPIDISALVGYNRIKSVIGLESDAPGSIQGENQEGEFSINSFTYQLVVSKKLSILTIYGGGGYSTASTDLKVTGTYEIEDSGNDLLPPVVLTDPVNENFKSDGWRGSLGLRLQLAIVTLHADYTFQEYNMLTAGLGISIR